MAHGAAWMVLAKFVERGLGLVSMLILARLLVPADFGLVAMATTLLAVLELLTAFGFDSALIRNGKADRSQYDTAWTLYVLMGVIMAVLLVALAYPLSWFYQEPRLVPVVAALALAAFVQAFENIGVVAFRMELDFRREFLFLGGKKLATFCTTVPLAFALGNYWALVAGMVMGRLVGVALSYRVHAYRPRFSLEHWRDMFGFSKWLLLTNAINFVRLRYADLVIGRIGGPTALGLYSLGSEIAFLPTTELVAPINRAVFPGYAQIAHDLGALRREFLAALGMIAFVALPAACGIAAIAPLLVPIMLGDKWAGAASAVTILAWVGALTTLTATSHSVFLARSKPWLGALVGGVQAILLVVLLPIFGVYWGLQGVLWATLLAAAITTPVTFGLIMRELELNGLRILALLWRPVAASVVMYLSVEYLVEAEAAWGRYVQLVSAVTLGVLLYPIVSLTLWRMSGRPRSAEAALVARAGQVIPLLSSTRA
jgi:O-antigen/teichoic acid export membrane protein